MRLIRLALALATIAPALVLALPSVGSAATRPAPTRIVLFDGRDATPVGPAVQQAGKWTVYSAAPSSSQAFCHRRSAATAGGSGSFAGTVAR